MTMNLLELRNVWLQAISDALLALSQPPNEALYIFQRPIPKSKALSERGEASSTLRMEHRNETVKGL